MTAVHFNTAIVVAARVHGETGVIVRLLTPSDGLVAGYVRGGRSRALRPVLLPGNRVRAELRVRSPDELGALALDLERSRAPWHGEPLPAAAIGWATTLVAATLPEQQPFPQLYSALDGLLEAICSGLPASRWAAALLAFERLLLRELGYGAANPEEADILAGLRASGAALAARLFADDRRDPLAARARLIDLLARAVA